jgi:hypothetical protein
MSDARPNTPIPDRLAAVRAELKRLETEEAALRATLLAEPDTRTGANWLAEIRTVTQDRTDLRELRAAYPDQVAEHTYPQEISRIVLMGIDQDTGEIVPARRMRATAGADQ